MERRPAGQGRNRVLRLLSLDSLFLDERCAEALSDERLLAAMSRFEGALARASARAGLIPESAAAAIAGVCEHARFDLRSLASGGRAAGTLAIPFVKALTEQVAAASPDAARYVHIGATSQDVIDTAVALCLQAATQRATELLARLGDALEELARRHARTPMVARTLLQPALPVPFGWKVASWLSPLVRSHAAFPAAAAGACVLQLGGAGGTLSSFGSNGAVIGALLSDELGLPLPPMSWHGARDRFARLGSETAMLTGAAAKIARDVSLLMQPEIGEVAEPSGAGRGGSSAMPHKRNPARCLLALEAGQRAPFLAATLLSHLAPEHERGLGQWQGEWRTLRELIGGAGSALAAMAETVEGLQVDVNAMRANLDATRGLAYSERVAHALASSLGKQAAHELTERLCRRAVDENKALLDVLREEKPAGLQEAALASLFEPEAAYGSAIEMLERTAREWRQARASAP